MESIFFQCKHWHIRSDKVIKDRGLEEVLITNINRLFLEKTQIGSLNWTVSKTHTTGGSSAYSGSLCLAADWPGAHAQAYWQPVLGSRHL